MLDEEEQAAAAANVKATGLEKIEKVVKGANGSDESHVMRDDNSDFGLLDFRSLARLNRRKGSPLHRLLMDVDQCMIDIFECIK